jgi:hypothetical protein
MIASFTSCLCESHVHGNEYGGKESIPHVKQQNLRSETVTLLGCRRVVQTFHHSGSYPDLAKITTNQSRQRELH